MRSTIFHSANDLYLSCLSVYVARMYFQLSPCILARPNGYNTVQTESFISKSYEFSIFGGGDSS